MIVSNTEISTFNLCEKQHSLRFIENLEPQYFSANTPIGLGIIGHVALDGYYTTLMQGGMVDDAVAVAHEVLDKQLLEIATQRPESFEELARVAHLKQLIETYRHHYGVEPFKVIAVEKEFQTPITSGINYGMKLDLIIEWTKGIKRGDLEVWDHKFVYNFKSRAELEMDCQLPKYIKTVRDSGYYITGGLFNQLRYRDMKNPTMDQLFQRSPMETTKFEIEQIWKEQQQTAEEIQRRQSGSTPPVRTQHILSCRGCYFQGLCKAELMGLDTSAMRVTNYRPAKQRYVDFIDTGAFFNG